MRFTPAKALLPALILSLSFTQACISVSYSGKSYTSTEKVEVLKKQKDIPAGYELMGKAMAHAPSEYGSRQAMEDKMIGKAKSEGADALMIVSFEEVKIGDEREDQFLNESYGNAGWGMNVNTEGDTRQIQNFHTGTETAERTQTPVYKSIMKAIFLKRKQ